MSHALKATYQQIIEAIEQFEEIIIFRHVRPDLDAVGSQLGLARLLENSYPDKKIYTNGEKDPWLTELIGPMHPYPAKDFSEQLVIVLDTANTKRLDGNDEKIQEAGQVIKIDHHPPVESYGDIEWVDAAASSTSELIAQLWFENQETFIMTSDAAYALYAGIVGDTNRFLYESTHPKTMQLAGELMTFHFAHDALHFKLAEITPTERRLIAYTLEHAQVTAAGVGYIIFTDDVLKELDATDDDTSIAISLVGNIQGVTCWSVFVAQPHGGYRCRIRSKGPAINEVAAHHDGGGHKLASGANAKDQVEIKAIIAELEQAVAAFKN